MNVYTPLKAAWHTDKIDDLRYGENIVPAHIHFVISDLCNQNCNFCSYRSEKGFTPLDDVTRLMPTDQAINLLDEFREVGVGAIEFTGGGEPTCHPDFDQIIREAHGFQLGLVTNGVKLKNSKALKDFDWIRVSLDAGTEETYEKTRGSKGWSKVMKTLDKLSRYKKPLIGIGFVITPDNYTEIHQAAQIARDHGMYIRYSAMFSEDGSDAYEGIKDYILQQLEAEKLMFGDTVVDLFSTRIADLDQGAPDYTFCGQQQFVLYIGADAKVYPCCTQAYARAIGDLNEIDFATFLEKRPEWDAKSCHHCQFNDHNRLINFLLDPDPKHVWFV